MRAGEGRKVFLTFLYFFLVITAYYLVKPVGRALVLESFGWRLAPYIDLVCAIVLYPAVTLFAHLAKRLEKPRLVTGSFCLTAASLLVFWKWLDVSPWVAAVFYVWVSVLAVILVALFWVVANGLYRLREGKRLFGFIGSGGILGGIVGSSLAAAGAQAFGTRFLIPLSACILLLSWLVVQRLWRFSMASGQEAFQPELELPAEESFFSALKSLFQLFLESRYLSLLAALGGLGAVVSALVFYQFNFFIERAFAGLDSKTTFMAIFFGGVNVAAFVIQFFFTSLILRAWGLRKALAVLPLGLLAAAAGFLFFPAFGLAASMELWDGAMNYSLQQTAKEMLYLPIGRSIRYKVKPFIDTAIPRFGRAVAAVVGIILLSLLQVGPRSLSFFSLFLVGAWLIVVIRVSRGYITTIRTALQARAVARRSQQASLADGSAILGPLAEFQSTPQKLHWINRLVADGGGSSLHVKDLVSELDAYENMSKRRHAARLLSKVSDQSTVDYLLGVILVETDAALRQEAVLGLVRLRLRSPELDFPKQPIRRQIAAEVENYQRIVAVASIYRNHHRGPISPQDPVLELLQALTEEAVSQVFRLLLLLYRPEDIHLIYEQMKMPDLRLRADALELLDNLVDPAMRVVLSPMLNEDRFLDALEQMADFAHEPTTAYRVLQEAIWDRNCWLSVTALCAIGRLRLTAMRQELERASRHQAPILSSAAKVALYLAAR